MKTLFPFLFTALAIAAADPEPSRPFELAFDYDTITPIRLYADGALLKQYSADEIMWISKATGSAFTNTYAITVPPLNLASSTLTATVLFSNGTNLIESAQSEPLKLDLRPRAPGILQPLSLVNDDAAIARIVQDATRAALARHPEWRSQFENAFDQITDLVHTNSVVDAAAILRIVQRYPQEELTGEARLLLKQFERGDATNPRAAILALLSGLRAGLTPK